MNIIKGLIINNNNYQVGDKVVLTWITNVRRRSLISTGHPLEIGDICIISEMEKKAETTCDELEHCNKVCKDYCVKIHKVGDKEANVWSCYCKFNRLI